MISNWLGAYLEEAVRKRLCTQIGCTTCGAMEFRMGVLSALASTGKPLRRHFDRESQIEIARVLAELKPNHDDLRDPLWGQEDAVRCILCDLWSNSPLLDREIEALLAGTWAGGLLRRMKEHREARETASRARDEFQSPANVQKRREEKKRVKQEQHEKRLALKKERDRLWRERHGKADWECSTARHLRVMEFSFWLKITRLSSSSCPWGLVLRVDKLIE
jgi:hypothetical protein